MSISRRSFIKATGASALAMGLAACGGSGASADGGSSAATGAAAEGTSIEGKTVAFIPKVTGNAFFESANAGAQKHAKDWGITVDYMGDATASVSAQVSVINQAVAQGVDAICISTVDANGVSDALKSATDAGIVVCTWDSDSNPEDRTVMVSQGTPEILGQMLVDMGVEGLKQRGKDPEKDAINYIWHYSQATVTDQNSWQVAAEAIIKEKYSNWVKVGDNQYSEQDAEKAITVGEAILEGYPDIDLIICNDSTALPGQLQAMENKGKSMQDITVTGFASPKSIKDYCDHGTIYNWGLWDCGVQGAMGCYMAAYLAAGNKVKIGDKVAIKGISDDNEILANDSIAEGAKTADENNGVVLLPERLVFTKENMNDYDF